ncbi:MAG TPA: UTP--glucose-1-phosphate uridylyltransferase [Patescibacteria group bacterium]|nr:UTP--glucose-1-phosphate uridylyltransferase [Patescibacteria group bacterium]
MARFKPVRKAVFPVAGLGTRFLPATKVLPKEMLPLGDRPLIQHAVEEAREAGIEEFIFVTGRHKEMLEEHFDYQPELTDTLAARGKKDILKKLEGTNIAAGKLFLTRQPKALGLGHAVWCARKLVAGEPFAVILPDDVFFAEKGCLAQMMGAYSRAGGNLMAVMEVPREETRRYGVLKTGKSDGRLVDTLGLVEKPLPALAPSNFAIIGRYILQPEIFSYLAAFEKGAGGEIQLTDAMAKLIGSQPFHGYLFEGERYDCGTRLGLLEANIAYSMRDREVAHQVRDIVAKYNDERSRTGMEFFSRIEEDVSANPLHEQRPPVAVARQ